MSSGWDCVDCDLREGSISFVVKHNVNDDVLVVLVVAFSGVEESVNREGFTSDIEASSTRYQILRLWMKLIYSPDPVRSAIARGPSDGEFSMAWAARNEVSIRGKFVLVGRASGISKLRLGLLDENTERNFCWNHFFCDRSLFGGVNMARGRLG